MKIVKRHSPLIGVAPTSSELKMHRLKTSMVKEPILDLYRKELDVSGVLRQ